MLGGECLHMAKQNLSLRGGTTKQSHAFKRKRPSRPPCDCHASLAAMTNEPLRGNRINYIVLRNNGNLAIMLNKYSYVIIIDHS